MTRVLSLVTFLCLFGAAGGAVHGQANPARLLAWADTLQGNEEHELRWPSAVAVSSDGEIAVADVFEQKLLLFRRIGVSWQLDRTVPLPAVPVGLAHDGERFIAALRQPPHLIALEGPQLAIRRLSLPANVIPGAIASIGGGELLVLDLTAGRVLRLSSGGEVVREIDLDRRVTALAALPSGGFLAAVGNEARLLRFDAAWNPQGEWELPASGPEPAWPAAIAVEPGGDTLVLDRHSGRILVFDATGRLLGVGSRRGWEPGLLLYPAAMARLPDGQLAVADQGNGRAQIFSRTDGVGVP